MDRSRAGSPKALPHVVRTVVEIAAPPAEVFEALTDPGELAAWWGGDDAGTADSRSEPWPGGTWSVRTVDAGGVERAVGGEYRAVDPPHHLEQTWRADGDTAESLVRYDLEPLAIDGADGTRLTVTHTSPTALATGPRVARWANALSRLAVLAVLVRRAPAVASFA